MMNLNYELKCVTREVMLAMFTDEMYLRSTEATDEKVIKIMNERMVLLTKLDAKVADIEMEAFKVNDKEVVNKCERIRYKIAGELRAIRVKYNF
jgi:hypothetical protein